MVSEWFSSVFLSPSFLVLVACGDCLAQSGQLYIDYALQGGFISEAAVDPDCGLPLFLIISSPCLTYTFLVLLCNASNWIWL